MEGCTDRQAQPNMPPQLLWSWGQKKTTTLPSQLSHRKWKQCFGLYLNECWSTVNHKRSAEARTTAGEEVHCSGPSMSFHTLTIFGRDERDIKLWSTGWCIHVSCIDLHLSKHCVRYTDYIQKITSPWPKIIWFITQGLVNWWKDRGCAKTFQLI